MFKKSIFAMVTTLALVSTLISLPAWAEEDYGIMPINETNEVTPINDDVAPTETTGEIAEPNETECPENDPTCKENIDLETGTMPDQDPALDEDNEIEEESEPELWPMYLSLGSLGAVVIVFIVLNLFGRKKK